MNGQWLSVELCGGPRDGAFAVVLSSNQPQTIFVASACNQSEGKPNANDSKTYVWHGRESAPILTLIYRLEGAVYRFQGWTNASKT
jgi:hypothetical protein